MGIVCLLLRLYGLAVLAWIVLSWVQVSSVHPLGRVQVFLDRIMYPIILPLRRVLPPLRLGGMALDLSPLVLLLGLSLVQRWIC
ncbi:MAG TPA: YggT family protein [Acidimicrobiia bacterium]|jgi:YggT family protein